MTTQCASIIDGCRLFARITPEARARLAGIARPVIEPARRMLFRQGDPCPGAFVVGSGCVRVFKLAPSGKEHILHLCRSGGCFAEAAAIGGFSCPAFAETVEDSVLALLPTGPFMELLRTDHRLCLDLLAGMAGWLHQLVDQVEGLVLSDAAGRLARWLLADARGTGRARLPSPNRLLALQLNLTAETLSRTLRRFAEERLIVHEGDAVTIIDDPGLAAVAAGA
jgi:CRP/FNR family transcriptional regulator